MKYPDGVSVRDVPAADSTKKVMYGFWRDIVQMALDANPRAMHISAKRLREFGYSPEVAARNARRAARDSFNDVTVRTLFFEGDGLYVWRMPEAKR